MQSALRMSALLLMSTIGTWAQPAVNAAIGSPAAVAVDASGNIYFCSSLNRVFKVEPSGVLTVVAGTSVAGYSGDGGPATIAELNDPQGLAMDTTGNLYIADSGNNRVRKVSPAGIITTVAGNGIQGYSGDNGPAAGAELNDPSSLAIDGSGNLYILHVSSVATYADMVVRKFSTANGTITTVAGGISLLNASGIAVNQAGTLYVAVWMVNSIYEFSPTGALVTTFKGAFGVSGVGVDRVGNLYAVDGCSIYAVSSSTGQLTAVAGDGNCGYSGDGGPAVQAGMSPAGIAFDSTGNLYIADSGNQRIRKVSAATGIIITLAGGGGPAISGVVNGASFQPGIPTNSWITILGSDLSSTTDTWANAIVNGKLPTSVDGVHVNVSGQPAYVSYVSPNQINAISPNLTPGLITVTVSSPSGTSNAFSVSQAMISMGPLGYGPPWEALQPTFFLWPGGYAVATKPDYSWAVKNGTFPGTTTEPARPGDVITFWGTGFGLTSPVAPIGVQTPTGTIYNTASPVTVTVGGKTAAVYGAALAPGYAGLYQVAIQIPPSLAPGDYPVVATIYGSQSPSGVLITVQQ